MIAAWIALGGAIGAVTRHLLSVAVATRATHWTAFPLGTFIVNAIGCLVAGVALGLMSRTPLSIEARSFLTVGILGGFTTYSAFAVETFLLLQNGHLVLAFANVFGTVAIALSAVWIGFNVWPPAP